ncbi:hypothetical protein EV175_000477 [Coemansia sp. RSA 1933]|nr:hypothetical protein EV175_000477 [Coemansia sp. RSA 1933]
MPVKSPVPDVVIPDVDITTFFFSKAQRSIDALAAAGISEPPIIIDAASGRPLRFSDVKRNSLAIARALDDLLLKDCCTHEGGDKVVENTGLDRVVLVLMRGNILYSSVHFGIMMAGCTHMLLYPYQTAQELADKFKSAGFAKVVAAFVEEDAVGMLQEATKIAGVELQENAIIAVAGDDDGVTAGRITVDDVIRENIDKPFTPYPFTAETLATTPSLIVHSSGTSGRAKGIILTHRNIVASCSMFNGSITETPVSKDQLPLRDNDTGIISSQNRAIELLSPFHIYGHTVLAYSALIGGGCVVSVKEFSTFACLEAVERYRITHFNATPKILHTLLWETTKVDDNTQTVVRLRDYPYTEFQIGSVVFVGCGGSPIPPAMKLKYSEYFGGAAITNIYGQTEASSIIASHMWGGVVPAVPGSAGVLAPNSLAKVVDAEGNETDEFGELCISGPHIMKSYIGNVKSPIVDGFFSTGDYARLSADGHVFLRGRLDDIVHTAQGAIVPNDIEEMLADNSSIIDSAVVGVGAKGEAQAIVFLALAQSDVPKSELLADIVQFVKSKTGNSHIIGREIAEIPKNPSGKKVPHLMVEQLCL